MLYSPFQDQVEIFPHQFQVGWKLEALNRNGKNQISPATVVKVFNNKYFLIEIDDLTEDDDKSRVQFSCHAHSRGIFPIQWCQWKGIKLTTPNGTVCDQLILYLNYISSRYY